MGCVISALTVSMNIIKTIVNVNGVVVVVMDIVVHLVQTVDTNTVLVEINVDGVALPQQELVTLALTVSMKNNFYFL